MTRIFVYTLLIIFFVGCASSKKNDIMLLNNYHFKLAAGEKVEPNDKEIVNRYEKYFNNDDSLQIPLYRYIKSTDYEMFIGIPMTTTLPQVSRLEMNRDTLLTARDTQTSSFKQYQKDSLYVTRYFTSPDRENLMAFFVLTKSEKISDSLFNEELFSERIYK